MSKVSDLIDRVPSEKLEELYRKIRRDVALGYMLDCCSDVFLRRSKKHLNKYIPYTKFKVKKEANATLHYIELALREMGINSIQADDMLFKCDGIEGFGNFQKDIYELVRLFQLYMDRCQDKDSAKKVQDFLLSLPSHNTFSEEEIKINLK